MSVSHSLIFPWTHTYKLIERPYFLGISGIRVKIKSVPKYFKSLVLNFTVARYALLFLNSEIYIVHVINCEWSRSVNFPLRMFCMRYKLCYSYNWDMCRESIEKLPRNLDGLRICQECTEQTERIENWLNGSTYLSRSYRGQTQKSR